MFLKPEILKLTNAYETFEALGKEFPNFGDILSKSHVSGSPTLLAILDKLSRMELVRKARPVNDEKKTGYYIVDPLSLFYFRHCFQYASQ